MNATTKRDLTTKQRKFVHLVARENYSNAEAARRAGYSKDSSNVIASENLTKPYIEEEIESEKQRIARKTGITEEYFVERARELLERCMQAKPVVDHEGNPTGEWKFDSAGANGALEKIAKWLGAYAQDNKQRASNVALQIAQFLESQTE